MPITSVLVSIKGLSKAAVLAALYNASHPQGLGILQCNNEPMSRSQAQALLDQKRFKFDYLKGRVMKVDLSGDEFDPWGYNRDNYPGAAQAVLDSVRKEAECHPDHTEEEVGTDSSLTSNKVEMIFMDCLYAEGEDTSGQVHAEGIQTTVGFHPERLESHRIEVEAMLGELPDEFKRSGGGGWSFLNACQDKHGIQWTDLHQRMEQLFQLGIAISKVEYTLPRDLWGKLPGGVPFYTVID